LFGEANFKPWNVQLPGQRGEKPHPEVIRQFARALLEDQPVPVPPEQSVQTIAMLEALYQSAAEGREVRIPPLADEAVIRLPEAGSVARSA
jgi:predicted dehydrogenase